jgi:hypothetical protein
LFKAPPRAHSDRCGAQNNNGVNEGSFEMREPLDGRSFSTAWLFFHGRGRREDFEAGVFDPGASAGALRPVRVENGVRARCRVVRNWIRPPIAFPPSRVV